MTRRLGEDVDTKVQVLDSNGNPATSATVHYIIYNPSNDVEDEGIMSHIANGIYTMTWNPGFNYQEDVGTWLVETYCTSPKFRKTFLYKVENTGWNDHDVEEYVEIAAGSFCDFLLTADEYSANNIMHITVVPSEGNNGIKIVFRDEGTDHIICDNWTQSITWVAYSLRTFTITNLDSENPISVVVWAHIIDPTNEPPWHKYEPD